MTRDKRETTQCAIACAIVFILLALAGVANAQGVLSDHLLENPDGGNTFYITSTASDTSSAFNLRWSPHMGYAVWAADTTADDSVDIDLTIQFQATNRIDLFDDCWTTAVTAAAVHTGDSTVVFGRFSTTAEEMALRCRYIITGSTDNSKASAVAVQVLHQSWFETFR